MPIYATGWTPIVELQTGQAVSDKLDDAFDNTDGGLAGLETMIGTVDGKNVLHGVVDPNVTILSINIDPTKYEVKPLTYYIKGVKYTFAGATLASGFTQAGDFIDVGLNTTGIITKTNAFFTPTELETTLEIGRLASSNGSSVTSVGDSVFFVNEHIQNLYIRFKSFEGTSFFDGASLPSINGTNKNTLNIQAGTINTANMQTRSVPAATQVTGSPIYNIAGDIGIRALQTPLLANNTQYDDGTNLASIPTGHYVQHTLFRSSGTGAYYLQYGQNTYTRVREAIDQDAIDSLFYMQGSEVEKIAKVIVQQGAIGIVGLIDIRGQRHDIIGILPVQADKVELGALNINAQEPSVANTPYQITFGTAQINDNLDLATNGTVTFKKAGNYYIELSLSFGRVGGAGEAILLSRTLVNDVQSGHTVFIHIDDSTDITPINIFKALHFNVGDTLKFEFYRDSTGTNSGGLYPQLSAIGWATAPSSCLIITSKD